MRGSARQIFPRVLTGLLCIALNPWGMGTGSFTSAADDDAKSSGTVFRRIYVPADKPEVWPKGDWQPVPLADFNDWVTASRVGGEPRTTLIESAAYSATLVNSTLEGGTLEWAIRRVNPQPELLELDPLNLAVSALKWANKSSQDSSAVWGTAPSGKSALWLDRAEGIVSGTWLRRGRALARSVEFDLRFPSAGATQFRIHLPANRQVETSDGEVTGYEAAAEKGWNVCMLRLGTRSSCRLRIVPQTAAEGVRPLLVSQSKISCVLRPEAARIASEFNIEVLEAPVKELVFRLPDDFQVVSVEYGDNGETPWRVDQGMGGRRLILSLVDQVQGSVPSIQFRGLMQVRPPATWTAPVIALESGVETEGQLLLRTAPPIQAADLRLDGYRQSDLTTNATEGETFTLRKFRPNATATIIFGDSPAELRLRGLSLVRATRDRLTLDARLEWTAATGNSFETTCRIPDGWEIRDVRSANLAPTSELTGWEVVTGGAGERLVRFRFLNAVSSEHSQIAYLTATRSTTPLDQPFSVPTFVPVETGDTEYVIVLQGEGDLRPVLEPGSGTAVVPISDLPADWTALEFWKEALSTSEKAPLILRGDRTIGAAKFRFWSGETTESRSTERRNVPAAKRTPGAEATVVTSMKVTAQLSCLPMGMDDYRTTFRLARRTVPKHFEFRLPAPSELTQVRVGGRKIAPEVVHEREDGDRANPAYRGTIVRVRAVDFAARGRLADEVEVDYRVPAEARTGWSERRVQLPEVDEAVLRFSLAVQFPPGVTLARQPRDVHLTNVGVSDSWRDHWLGPLSRGLSESTFQPFRWESWQGLWNSLRNNSPAGEPKESESDGNPPHGWTEWHLVTAGPPEHLKVTLCQVDQARWWCWAALTGTFLAGLAIRTGRVPFGKWIGAIVPAVAFWFVARESAILADLAGSVVAGTLFSVLWPSRRLLKPWSVRQVVQPVVPVGSTQSFASPRALIVAALGLGLGLTASAQEQDSGVPKIEKAQPGKLIVPVLIPIGKDSSTDGQSTIVYVPGDMASLWKKTASASADYLISSARYEGTVLAEGNASLLARFEVFVMSPKAVVPVSLPLTGVNLGGNDACVVDGKPHSVIAGPRGNDLIVELAGIQRSEQSEPTPQRRLIEFHLHPQISQAGTSPTARMSIPPIADSRVVLSASMPWKAIAVESLTKTIVFATSEQGKPARAEAVLGRTTEMRWRWYTGLPREEVPGAEAEVTWSCLADVTAACVQLKCHVQYRLQSGEIDSLVWRIPASFSVQAVQAPSLADYEVETESDGARRVVLEFAKPMTEEFDVTGTFVLPRDSQDASQLLPAMDFFASGAARVHTTVKLRQIAFRPPVEDKLEVAVDGEGILIPRTTNEFLDVWAADGARPPKAYQFEVPTGLRLTLTPVRPALHVQTRARYHVRPGRIDLSLEAEVERPEVSLHIYRLRVDPRMRVTRVSVQEDGADRLWRWSQTRDHVVLFLNDRATRLQTIRLEATTALSEPEAIDLPRVRFEESLPMPQQWTISAESEVAVRLHRGDGTEIATEPGPMAGTRKTVVARFDVAPNDSPIRATVERSPLQLESHTSTSIEKTDDGWRLQTTITCGNNNQPMSQLVLDAPEDITQQIKISCEPTAEIVPLPSKDGRAGWLLQAAGPVNGTWTVRLHGPNLPANAEEWSVPDVRIAEATTQRTACVPRDSWVPEFRAGASETAKRPDAEIDGNSKEPDGHLCFQLSENGAKFRFRRESGGSGRTRIALAEYHLWPSPSGQEKGRAVFRMHGGESLLRLAWPAGSQLTAATVNGRAFQLKPPPNSFLEIPLVSSGEEQTSSGIMVSIGWTANNSGLPLLFSSIHSALPAPEHAQVDRQAIVLHLPTGYRARETLKGGESPSAQINLLRIQAMQDINRNASHNLFSGPKEIDADDSLIFDATGESEMLIPAQAAFDRAKSMSGSPENGLPTSIEVINRGFLYSVGAGLAALLAAWLCRRTKRIWAFIQKREPLCWGTLGCAWWAFMQPSVLGLAWIALAVIQAVRLRKHSANWDDHVSTAYYVPKAT